MALPPPHFVILGAGVVGLTTALELASQHPNSKITILANYMPGDRSSTEYTSPWAGANWLSVATDNGRQESWDRVTYLRFGELADGFGNGVWGRGKGGNECGIKRETLRGYFDSDIKDAGVLSKGTGQIWYKDLVKDFRFLTKEEVEEKIDLEGKKPLWGYEFGSFVIDVPVYLAWLQGECLKLEIEMHKKHLLDIHEAFEAYPDAKAYFNCTGLGSYHLKGVEDHSLFPARGQILLVENTEKPMHKMYFRSPQRVNPDATYVFPRNPGGGVILGGCRVYGSWDGNVDLSFAEDIKKRCVALAPELGKVEDLKVISHGVGLRPSRKGGARIEKEVLGRALVIHNYGAGGAGYQASWGMAKEAVGLLPEISRL